MNALGGRAGLACMVSTVLLLGSLGGTAAAQTSVPASIPATGAVLTKVTVGGEPAWMQVDTGATSTVIDARVAKELGLPAAGEPETATTLGCKTTTQPVTVSGWTLGKLPLPETVVSSVRQPGKLPTSKGLPVLGLLGNDVLAGFGVVSVDFVDKRLILGGPFAPTGRQLAAELLRDRDTGTPALFASAVELGGESLVFAVDTGAALTVIDGKVARRLKLKRSKEPVKADAVACAAKVRPVLLPSARSGRVRLAGGIGFSNRGGLADLGIDGLLGVPQLAGFGQVTFDYERGRVGLGFPLPPGTTPGGLPD